MVRRWSEGGQKRWSELTERQSEVVRFIQQKLDISRKELSEKLKINPSAVQKHIESLRKKEVIKRVGPDKGGHWEILIDA
ncbi:MAG: winged helix-turn-helix transcriptional regulator [Candidatus Omnitrophica bacterium]|nr:winged helix-turn-helix transcriptional regulator [Candidatus Omnitrophota bacterium]